MMGFLKFIIKVFHRHRDGEPCPQMEELLQLQVSGQLGGFAKWYALAHVARCSRCRHYLEALEATLRKLHQAGDTLADQEAIARLSRGSWRSSSD